MTAGVLIFRRGPHRYALSLERVLRVLPHDAAQAIPQPVPGVKGWVEADGILHTLLQTALPERAAQPAPEDPTETRPSTTGEGPQDAQTPARPGWILLREPAGLGFHADHVESLRDLAGQPGCDPSEAPLSPMDTDPAAAPPCSRGLADPGGEGADSPIWWLDLAALLPEGPRP